MLINLTNHPSHNWETEQLEAAEKHFGSIRDIPFPQIKPEASSSGVKALAVNYSSLCADMISESSELSNAVHIMGEMTFSFNVIRQLKNKGVTCVASTTNRIVTENKNGSKNIKFKFVRFREY